MNNKIYKIIIGLLVIIIIYLSFQIVRLENYHYAVQIGFCGDVDRLERDSCLNKTQTRINPIWHLLYGLKVLR